MLWILRTGAPWRDLPERFGPLQSVYHRFSRRRRDGAIDRTMKVLRIRLDREGKTNWDLWCVDGTSERASRKEEPRRRLPSGRGVRCASSRRVVAVRALARSQVLTPVRRASCRGTGGT